MIKKIIPQVLFPLLLLPSLSYATSLTCNPCLVNDCRCTTDCDEGTLDVYNNADCIGIPIYTFPFSGGSKTWKPTETGTKYLRVLCDDNTRSDCTPVYVSSTTTSLGTTSTILRSSGTGIPVYIVVSAGIAVLIVIILILMMRK